MAEADVLALRAQGLDDRAVHDATQVVSYFNYINRIADALHVELEPEMPPDPRGAGSS
jgi:alkylhydroperoxidase family enzyme